jgi:hypothetical protein
VPPLQGINTSAAECCAGVLRLKQRTQLLVSQFELGCTAQSDEQRDGSEDPEAAIDESPEGRDTADRAGDERQGKHPGARDEAELQDPLIADWVDERADENNSKGEVCER